MGRVEVIGTFEEMRARLGWDERVRIEHVEVDGVRRTVGLVARSVLFVEQPDDDDGVEPECWPFDALKPRGRFAHPADRDEITTYGEERDQENGFALRTKVADALREYAGPPIPDVDRGARLFDRLRSEFVL